MDDFIKEDYIINEGLLPMNFNFQQAKQRVNQQHPSSYPPGFDDPNSPNFNPMINMNDPEVRAMVDAQRKRDEESAKQQRIENYKQYSRNILFKVNNAVLNLIKGNAHPNFTEQNQRLLQISLENKIYEILNENKLQIDNNILLNVYLEMLIFQRDEYSKYVNIHKFESNSINTIGYNKETGVVMANPDYIYGIVHKWCVENRSHYQEDSQIILS